MGKYQLIIGAALSTAIAAAPALAQETPVAAKDKAPPKTIARPGGAVSSSYARCAPGSPIGGIVVKGGVNPTRREGAAEPECQSTTSSEAVEGRTYTGGRRNEDAPAAAVEATAAGDVPSRLSMTPTTAKTVTPSAPAGKSINEKGLPAPKPH
ncbi:hypothetical protein HNP52_000991 [Sphingomonas kyeonggiensis]|uniref:Uncharacterized protein n=1 Tax=Sphingomonas kyeonggiensis TaxID=1268553 RepID=A0A7W7K068_9SPHN|nr:hypothetical protein [Sphingomonas kyeonggiensis]MBB4837940.1 hypothetical protein [Sphingomonas kyeonggiensis]